MDYQKSLRRLAAKTFLTSTWPLALLLGLASLAPLTQAAPLFTAVVIGCASPNISNSSVPVSVQTSCSANSSVIGTAAGSASAGFGSVGAGTNSATTSGTDVPIQITATAVFSDTLTFSKTDPNAPNQFPVSLNLAFAGVVNSAASAAVGGNAGALVDVFIGFLGTSILEFFHNNAGFTISNPHGLGGTGAIAPGAGGFSTVLTTQQQLAMIGDIFFSLQVFTQVGTSNVGSSAVADFSNTLEFPTGIDVFNLPDGYTVNAGDYLVNNRFINPNGVVGQVPEPSSLALLGISLGAFLGIRPLTRRRRLDIGPA